MTFQPRQLWLAVALTLAAGACAPTDGTTQFGNIGGQVGPQYAPDDPCKGVVPQLCANNSRNG